MRLTLSPTRRLPGRAALAVLIVGGSVALTGCEQVAIIRSAPVAANFDQKSGNTPLAAADANALETGLRQRGQDWTMRFEESPASAGLVKIDSSQSVLQGRARTTSLAITLVATADATVKGFSSLQPQGEQAYLTQLIQLIENAGYVSLRDIRVDVWYQRSHHSTLTWTPQTHFVYTVLDGQP